MTKWTVERRLISPVRALPDRILPCHVDVRIQLAPQGAGSQAGIELPDNWRQGLTEIGVDFASAPQIQVDPALPAPWQAAPLPFEQLLAAELARGLCLSAVDSTSLTGKTCLAVPDRETLNEALALALVKLAVPLDFRNDALHRWQSEFSAVMFERSTNTIRIRRSSFTLLALGYQLLDIIIGLRSGIPTLSDYEHALSGLQKTESLPMAFRILFWWEATYRLTETGNFDDAEVAHDQALETAGALKSRLPGMAEEVDVCLLGLQHGRLAYYNGNFPLALRCFALEFKNLVRTRESRPAHLRILEARLLREAANVFSDLGYLQGAEALARQALTLQERTDDPERFKTLGRLGEILLRQGVVVEASRMYEASLSLQEIDDLPLDQTLTYLGHAAVMQKRFSDAEAFYARGWEALSRATVAGSSAYLWMGEVALAQARHNTVKLNSLAEAYAGHQALRGPRVLPRAVGATGLWKASLVKAEVLAAEVETLLAASYWLEALYPIRLLHPAPSHCTASLSRIQKELLSWQQAAERAITDGLGNLPIEPEEWAVGHYAAALAQAIAENTWQPLETLAKRIYPFSLLET